MSPELIITDVTRMRAPKVCVAGVHQHRTVRLNDPHPTDEWVTSIDGLVPGDVVSLEWKPASKALPPHTEDVEWEPRSFTKHHRLAETDLVDLLSANSFTGVREAFGAPWFVGEGGNAAFQPGRGKRSLASVMVRSPQVYPHFEGIKVDFADSQDSWTRVRLEDLIVRHHQKRCTTCSSQLSSLLAKEFEGEKAVLRLGLARQFQAGHHPSACWMQVNHIFLIPPKRKHFV
jgi:hypothetical protein